MTFVDLDRSFIPIGKEAEPDFDIGHIWGRKIGGWLTWAELLGHGRVVLLAEASSGKTAEFRARAAALRAEGRAAFFVPIEELADLGFEAVLGSAEVDLFETWKNGAEDGWFFLDSVDEARLNRRSFDLALKRFARELGAVALGRARVLVSCRASDWRGVDDQRSIESLLPFSQKPASAETPPGADAALLSPIFEEKTKPAEPPAVEFEPPKADELLIVQFVPLSDEQRQALAAGSGVDDPGAFAAAISRHGLDTLSERPGDLLDLAGYWKRYGRFGTFADMTEHGVARKLVECHGFRPDNDALAPQKAREGAERLAVALTLAKSFTLRAPGHDPDPTLAVGALEPAAILDEWTDAERNAVSRRGVFVPATYGRIRFHHRSTQEYLAATWLDRLLRDGCPRAEVFGLLFNDRYGVETVVPSLRPAAAWLALRHTDIRDEIVRREPLILLRHGDPGALPLETKKHLLLAFASKHAAGEIADDSLDHRALWMFADPALAAVIREAWRVNDRPDFRIDLLRLIREGAIADCVDLAGGVAGDENAGDYHRIVALEAMKACGDNRGLAEAARSLLSDPARASPRLVAGFARILFPHYLTVGQLLEVIEKSQPAGSYTVEGFGYAIDSLWAACPSGAARDKLMAGLADLCLREPYAAEYCRISQRQRELAKHLGPIARSAVVDLGDRDPPESLVRLLMVVERAERGGRSEDEELPLATLVRANPKLHRALFWSDVKDSRRHKGGDREPIRHWQIWFGGSHLWAPDSSDLVWLYDDLATRAHEGDRRIALSVIVAILTSADRLSEEADTLRARIAGDTVLNQDLDGYLAPPHEEDEATRDMRERREKMLRERAEQEERDKASWIKLRDELQANPSQLADPAELAGWPGVSRLLNLTQWLRRRTGADVEQATLQWRLLEEGFSLAVAEAYRDGMKALWRLVDPERPKRKEGSAVTVKWTTVLSFAGLAIEAAESPAWAARLTEVEAHRAARHGCMAEQGYPEWIEALASAHPEAAIPAVREALKTEWSSKRGGPSYFLYRYANSTYSLSPLIEPAVYGTITGPEARDLNALDNGLRILQRIELNGQCRRQLAALARRRFRKHVAAQQLDRALRYLALLLLVDVVAGVDLLVRWLRDTKAGERRALAERVFGALFGRHDPLITVALEGAPVRVLEELVLFAYQQVRPDDDNVHDSVYTPNARDDAESGRNTVLKALFDASGAEAYAAMRRLADHPGLGERAHRFRELARGMAERDAEMLAWTVAELLAFERRHVAPAKSGTDLFRITLAVLDDIRFEFEKADASSRPVVETAADEEAIQNWLAEQLRLRSRDRFHIYRESEVAGGDMPDVIVASTTAPCEVAIEVKHGGKRWTVRQLEDALRQQLAENYLKPMSRRHGVFVVTYHRRRTWRHPTTGRTMTFSEVIAYLTAVASSTDRNDTGPIQVVVRGIDASGAGVLPREACTRIQRACAALEQPVSGVARGISSPRPAASSGPGAGRGRRGRRPRPSA